jgi:hypothetical protein
MTMVSLLMVLMSCHHPVKDMARHATLPGTDSIAGMIMADTIIYEVIISNPDPDNAWAKKCLGGLHRTALIDSIFSMIYAKKVPAFNYDTHEKLTLKQVRDIEKTKEFKRENIGMIQFTEVWYLNTVANTMTKKVLSLVLGYDFYTSDGELFGHKPLFRVEMNS